MSLTQKMIKEYFSSAQKIVLQAGKILLKYDKTRKFEVISKKYNDVYCSADKESEDFFLDKISTKFPNHFLLSEEISFSKKEKHFEKYRHQEFSWILDPLDGTHNFINGIPFYCISLAFQHYDNTLFGIVYAPQLNEYFYAIKGSGCYYRPHYRANFKKVEYYGHKNQIRDSLIACSPSNEHPKDNIFFNQIDSKCRSTRKLGSLALELCYVGLERLDAIYKSHTYPWDIAAGALFLSELNVCISNGLEKDFTPLKKELFVANPSLYPKLLKYIQ